MIVTSGFIAFRAYCRSLYKIDTLDAGSESDAKTIDSWDEVICKQWDSMDADCKEACEASAHAAIEWWGWFKPPTGRSPPGPPPMKIIMRNGRVVDSDFCRTCGRTDCDGNCHRGGSK